jgi:acylphosphatase
MKCAYLKVKGRVQGVGFRWYAMQNANQFGLTGYVKNLSDGSVEIRVEGEKELIERFKSVMEKGPGFSSVDEVEFNYEPYMAKYDTFSVDY